MKERNNYKDSWSISNERQFIENLLYQRINFFLVFYSVILAGALNTRLQSHLRVVLLLGTTVCLLLTVSIYLLQQKVEILIKMVRTDEHPAAIVYHNVKESKPGLVNALHDKGIDRKLIGYYVPGICSLSLLLGLCLSMAGIINVAPRDPPNSQAEADAIRAIERQRLRSLVNADMEVARQLHANDFQLINPRGETYSKEQYLGGIASGELDYLQWEPEEIEVRVYGEGAVIRYRSQLEIEVGGQKVTLRRHWHADSYEKRNGQWQVVWSQATEIK